MNCACRGLPVPTALVFTVEMMLPKTLWFVEDQVAWGWPYLAVVQRLAKALTGSVPVSDAVFTSSAAKAAGTQKKSCRWPCSLVQLHAPNFDARFYRVPASRTSSAPTLSGLAKRALALRAIGAPKSSSHPHFAPAFAGISHRKKAAVCHRAIQNDPRVRCRACGRLQGACPPRALQRMRAPDPTPARPRG
jgi:hypothetical protein